MNSVEDFDDTGATNSEHLSNSVAHAYHLKNLESFAKLQIVYNLDITGSFYSSKVTLSDQKQTRTKQKAFYQKSSSFRGIPYFPNIMLTEALLEQAEDMNYSGQIVIAYFEQQLIRLQSYFRMVNKLRLYRLLKSSESIHLMIGSTRIQNTVTKDRV